MTFPRIPTAFASVFVAALAAFGSVACATASGGGGGAGVPDFPTREAVVALAHKAPPPAPATAAPFVVASWTLAGPFSDTVGEATMTGGEPLADVVLGAVPIDRTRAALACGARELGRFLEASGDARPEPRLERYMLTRCGSSVESVGYRSFRWTDVAPGTTPAALVDSAKDKLAAAVKEIADDGSSVGAALLIDTDKKTATAYFVEARPRLALRPASQLPKDGALVVDGALAKKQEIDAVFAYVTQGALGAADCTRDTSVALPAFRFRCPVAADDATALVEVQVRDKGRLLSNVVGGILAVQDRDAAATWTRLAYVPETPMPAPAQMEGAVLALLNQLRAQTGAGALQPATEESAFARKLVPHYFARALGADRDDETLDTIALGLMAGWDVRDMLIHDASFASLVDNSGRLDQALAEALDHPGMRRALLAKDATRAAVGADRVADGVTGLLVVDYEPLVVPADPKAEAVKVWERLSRERAERGLGPLGVIPIDDVVADAQARLLKGEDIAAVGKDALSASVNKMKREMGAWELDVYDAEHFTFPERLFSTKPTYAAIAVATHRRKGSAWGSTAVLILYTQDDDVRAADAAAPGRAAPDARRRAEASEGPPAAPITTAALRGCRVTSRAPRVATRAGPMDR